jgi:hypothetical protein
LAQRLQRFTRVHGKGSVNFVNVASRFGSLTTCARAQACAGSHYPFLTLKERDIETGLDYFLARYYSSGHGRFTSPHEFTGGPEELYYFVDDAADNPTFTLTLLTRKVSASIQYAYNNPLRYTDPTGHWPDGTVEVTKWVARTPAIPAPVKTDIILALAPVIAIDSIPGDNSQGDGSCPACDGFNKAFRDQKAKEQAEQQAAQQEAQNQQSESSQGGGGYINVPDPKNAGPGKKFTRPQRKQILEANKEKNDGELRSDKSGQRLNPPTRTSAGQRRDPNEAQVDHIRARSRGGTNRSRNAQVLSGRENRKKGTNDQ